MVMADSLHMHDITIWHEPYKVYKHVTSRSWTQAPITPAENGQDFVSVILQE
jgi:hypothetical protein